MFLSRFSWVFTQQITNIVSVCQERRQKMKWFSTYSTKETEHLKSMKIQDFTKVFCLAVNSDFEYNLQATLIHLYRVLPLKGNFSTVWVIVILSPYSVTTKHFSIAVYMEHSRTPWKRNEAQTACSCSDCTTIKLQQWQFVLWVQWSCLHEKRCTMCKQTAHYCMKCWKEKKKGGGGGQFCSQSLSDPNDPRGSLSFGTWMPLNISTRFSSNHLTFPNPSVL